MKKNLIVSVLKGMVLLLLTLLVCKYTKGGGAALIVAIGLGLTLSGKLGWTLICYAFFPFCVVTNPFLFPKEGITGQVLRLGPMIITMALVLSGVGRQGRHQIPIGMIWVYLAVAAFCSIDGYYPEISYLKIINCAILFLGLQLGFRNIDKRPQDVETVRMFFLVITSFIVWGSWGMRVFMPGAAYLTSLGSVIEEEGMAAAAQALRQMSGMKLFAGVTNQSQCLAIVLPASLAWLACDMFFVERKMSRYHVMTILAGLPLVYMTRSRSAMLTTCVALFMMYFYCMGKVNLRPVYKARMRAAMNVAIFLIICAVGVMEARSQAITKWIRKADDLTVRADQSAAEAFTSSRMSLVEQSMHDFRRNPLFGSGFQVSEDMKYHFRHHKGLILSASIEKGVLPVMVLGETGILGEIAFVLFLISFYAACKRKMLYCTATLFTVYLATNMAEATFFSPGGIGGILWVMCLGGGFVLDTVVLYRHRLARIAQEQQFAMMQQQMMAGG